MSNFQGKFVWYELLTSDVAGAEAFYKSVIGWGARDAGHATMAYTVFTAGEAGVGGIWEITEDVKAVGGRPGWVGYIQVDDIALSAAQVAEAGGAIHVPPQEIPGVGLFAVATDPQHAKFILFQQPTPTEPDHSANGHVGWHELYATDYAADFEFYAKLFGWTKADAIDMGPMGLYQMFTTGGNPIGGMMNKPEPMPANGWLFYFNVDSAGAAVARLESAGGHVVHGPMQVPGGHWIVQALDPQGVLFAVVSREK